MYQAALFYQHTPVAQGEGTGGRGKCQLISLSLLTVSLTTLKGLSAYREACDAGMF